MTLGDRARIPLIARLRTRLKAVIGRYYVLYLNTVWGMDIGEGTRISLSARKLDISASSVIPWK